MDADRPLTDYQANIPPLGQANPSVDNVTKPVDSEIKRAPGSALVPLRKPNAPVLLRAPGKVVWPWV